MNEWMGFIGVIVGALIAGVSSYIQTKSQSNNETKKIQLTFENEKKRDNDNLLRETNEFLIETALKIQTDYSLSKNYIMETTDYDIKKIHEKYELDLDLIRKANVKAIIYFKEVADSFKRIDGLANRVWGIQQNYFGYSKDKPNSKSNLQVELIELFDKVYAECDNIKNQLK